MSICRIEKENPNRSPTQYPQGARRIRKAAKPPTAAQWVRFGSEKQARPAKKPRRKAGIRAIRACLELAESKGFDLCCGAGHLGLKRAAGTFPSALGFKSPMTSIINEAPY